MGTNEPTSGNLGNLWFVWPLILKLAKPPYIKVKRMWNVSSLSLHRLKCIISCHHCRVAASVDPSHGTEFPLNQLVCLRVMTYNRSVDNRNLHISCGFNLHFSSLLLLLPWSTYPPVHGKLPLEAGSWNRCWFETKRGETVEICEVGFSAVFTAPSGNLT